MKNLFLVFVGMLVSAVALADTYTVHGSWTDTTVTGPEYVPQYHAQCQVNAVLAYEDLTLTSPNFSTALTSVPADIRECRVRNVNIVVASTPVLGNWSPWISGSVATMPADPSTVILIQIHSAP